MAQAGSLAARLCRTPNVPPAKAALRRVEALRAEAAGVGEADLAAALGEAPVRDLLAALAAHSPFLWGLAARDPARLARLLLGDPDATNAALIADQRGAGALAATEAGPRLRRNRAAHALLVALADLGGLWPLETVTAALSDFADASVNAAVTALLAEAAAIGRYRPPDPGDLQAGSGLVVLGLGKLGARELNYSSDIDLVVFFDPRAPLKDGLEPTPFFTRLAQGVSRLLQERTGQGYVHRVDYRLRPDPGATPTAVPLPSAYAYYETLGQNWERAAFIKARPVAGDLALGATVLAELVPFVWRRYFDFAAIADVHAMKRQIHAVRGHETLTVEGHDIKLGRGGIREVEFFVQTQQLVFGGRRPGLRGRATVPMLGALHDEGWITAAARDELGQAYRFLRTVEHRLQMVADEQTQRLPAEPAALASLARFAGFPDRRAFSRALIAHGRRVQAHYALLFEAAPELATAVGSLVFTGAEDDPETLATLARLGFRDPARAADTVRGWHFGRRPAVRTPRAREILTELTPSLLQALAGTPDPDGALAALDRAFGRMPAAAELMAILRSHERLRLLFADLLGTAPRLAQAVAEAPHVLDAVLEPALGRPASADADLPAEARALAGPPEPFEAFLDRARDAARTLSFTAGARLVSGITTPAQAGEAHAGIAEGIVGASLAAVTRAFSAEHGRVPGAEVSVLGLGRLGARALTPGSDLDLVVLYDFDPARRTSDGPRPLDAVTYHNRLAQRLVAALTVPTRRGRLYEVDLRLRPQGGKGPVAVQMASFLAYQAEEAELWEHMALTRARAVAGDAALCARATAAVRAILTALRDPGAVMRAVGSMRALVAREKGEGGPHDLKLAPGGLLDLDFLAQGLVLGHAHHHPDLAGLDTPQALARAGALGLLPEAEALVAAHRLLDDAHQWSRLLAGEAEPSAPALHRIATALGFPDARAMQAEIRTVRTVVRAVFTRTCPMG